jgi:hypothetical protein
VQAPISVLNAVSPANSTNLWGSPAGFTAAAAGPLPFTYQWKKGGVNLANGGNLAGVDTGTLNISGVTGPDAGVYTVGVTNSVAGVLSSTGNLVVQVPPPTFGPASLSGGNVNLSFTSSNPYDTTNAFILQSAPVVEGPYTNTPATVTSNGTFQILIPKGDGNMFYKLQHVP